MINTASAEKEELILKLEKILMLMPVYIPQTEKVL